MTHLHERPCRSDERLMTISPERIFYVGLLGEPATRQLGSTTVYAAFDAPVRLRLADGPWQTTSLAVVPPYVPHQVACDGRHIGVLGIEPETVAPHAVPAALQAQSLHTALTDHPDHPTLLRRLHTLHEHLLREPCQQLSSAALDQWLWGQPLAMPTHDARIARVLHGLRTQPHERWSADDAAASACLSFSRFLHLFKAEVGVPYRKLRTWKRARCLLGYANGNSTLTNVALDTGYPDSTHFSHSIRQVYGLKPRDILAGSRKLRVMVA
jgi:AraC-like DNA-binding protein